MLGDKLEPGQESKSGLYGIVSTMNDKPLRVAMDKNIASVLADGTHRCIKEAYVI